MSAPDDIAAWLAAHDLAQYTEIFAENAITADVLLTLTDDDLRELGVKALGHRKKMLAEIAKVKAAPKPKPAEQRSATVECDLRTRPAAPAKIAPARPEPPCVEPPPPPAQTRPEVAIHHATSPRTVVQHITPPKRPEFWARLLASKFLFVSIIVHLLFGVGATYFIVQRIAAKRKVTFQGGPPTTNPSKRALEHSVAMAKKKSGGAPPQAKRIVTAGLAKISLPDMPSIPTANTVTSGMMAGLGGAGFGQGFGFGNGMGSGMGGGGGGGGSGFSFFGFRGSTANIVFVIDISGSMVQGRKDRTAYDRLEKEVLTALTALGPTTKFNIIAFAGQPFVYAPAMASATPVEKQRATTWLKGYSPCNVLPNGVDKGNGRIWTSGAGTRHAGTSSKKALERAFDLRPGTIVFVSDGEPTDARPKDILQDVAEWQKKLGTRATINAFAYKADSGDDFMEKLAKGNSGEFKNIR